MGGAITITGNSPTVIINAPHSNAHQNISSPLPALPEERAPAAPTTQPEEAMEEEVEEAPQLDSVNDPTATAEPDGVCDNRPDFDASTEVSVCSVHFLWHVMH